MRSSPGSSGRDSRGMLFLDNLDMEGIEGDVLEKAVLSEVSPAFPLDLPVPIWLSKNIREFQRKSRTDFRQDSFLEHIPFDALHIEVIED